MSNFIKRFFSPKSATLSAPQKLDADGWIPTSMFSNSAQSSAGIVINETTALFNSAVFACQRGISESLALIPRDLYKKEARQGRVQVDEHASIRAITLEANPLMSAFSFFSTVQHHALSSGNGYAELQFQRQTGKVVAMWPIPSEVVTPKVYENELGELDLLYIVKTDSGDKILTKEQMLHIPGLGYDGIRGYPVVQLMANAVGLGVALEEFGALYFKQGADIAGYVSVPDSFSEDQIKNLKKHNDIHNSGLSNMHRFKFLYESAKFTPSGAKPEESQMLQSRVFQIQEVARYHRYPLHKLQELSKSPNHNSLEQFNIEFVSDTLMPWIKRWEEEINRKFFNDPSDKKSYIKFNVNAMLRGDSTSRASFYRTMVMSGIMTANEVRGLEDLPPIEGGDERLVPLNMTEGSEKQLDAKQRVQD